MNVWKLEILYAVDIATTITTAKRERFANLILLKKETLLNFHCNLHCLEAQFYITLEKRAQFIRNIYITLTINIIYIAKNT